MIEKSDNLYKKENKNINPEFIKNNFGTRSEPVLLEMISRASSAMPCNMSQTERDKIITQSVHEMKPQDPIEAKLCAKEAAIFALAMKYLQRAEVGMFSEQSDVGSRMLYETNMNIAVKLLRAHNETIETLSRYKRGGEQKVLVQHQYGVQVNEGGKAVISTQFMATGEGLSKKVKEEPHGSSEPMRGEIENQRPSAMSIEGIKERKVSISRGSKHRAKGSGQATAS